MLYTNAAITKTLIEYLSIHHMLRRTCASFQVSASVPDNRTPARTHRMEGDFLSHRCKWSRKAIGWRCGNRWHLAAPSCTGFPGNFERGRRSWVQHLFL